MTVHHVVYFPTFGSHQSHNAKQTMHYQSITKAHRAGPRSVAWTREAAVV